LNGIFKNNISNFALSLLTMPQRFYLDEISLHAAVTTGEEA